MYLCILDAAGQTLLHQNSPASPKAFLAAIAHLRAALLVGWECMFAWYWLAELCQHEGLPFVLGHALVNPAPPASSSRGW